MVTKPRPAARLNGRGRRTVEGRMSEGADVGVESATTHLHVAEGHVDVEIDCWATFLFDSA